MCYPIPVDQAVGCNESRLILLPNWHIMIHFVVPLSTVSVELL